MMERHTARLQLRDFREDDWPAVLAYQSNPLYLRYYAWTERMPEAVQAFVHHFVDQQNQQPRTRFQLAIVLPASGQLIGNCGIRQESPASQEAEIGYELDPEYWGRGYATEAACEMLAFGFTELGLHRVSSWCVADNTASAHVLEKLGLRLEGRVREKEYYKGRWWDVLLYGILRKEWEAIRENGGR